MEKIIEVKKNEKLLSIIIKKDYQADGVNFFTPDDYSQQVAYMSHPAGKRIDAHVHNIVHRQVVYTQEVLFIKKGKLRVDFYDEYKEYLESYILGAGDIILLTSGGHGFEILEDVEMIEVKQGPYSGARDKTRFEGIDTSKIIIKS